ncbi:Cell division protein FtsA [Candidatus Hydrogenisulfobacillus filiaventi]|uniref:Cell division protein FtsA n=1 Tax=Candidatus Hydrogenisulfobacillus filiaventi TaxID=2707344 RepID=A0A6F8ZEW3_9FIRM|nr:Cell division protein FtsA [Candidatus Hydrogenisulfobacillus filiaventi]
MGKRELVLAVDVGTTKAAGMVAEVDPGGQLAVLGVAATPVVGVRRGLVVDLERAALAVRDAVNRANSMAGSSLTRAAVAVGGAPLGSLPVTVARPVQGSITADDVRRLLLEAGETRAGNGQEAVEAVLQEARVDGTGGILNPVGMSASRLELAVLVLHAQALAVRNLRRVLALAGLSPWLFTAAPKAAAEAVLGTDERQLGVVLLDIGGGTTGLAVYRQGRPVHFRVLPLGGDLITSDLSVGLGVVATQAERLKLDYARVGPGTVSEGTVLVRAVNGPAMRSIALKDLQHIVAARVDEWVGFVEKELRQVSWNGGPAAGVVLTGGGALLRGLKEYLEARWAWPVRLGVPADLGGLSDLSRNPGYAVVAGVARTAARQGPEPPEPGWWRRLRGAWTTLRRIRDMP